MRSRYGAATALVSLVLLGGCGGSAGTDDAAPADETGPAPTAPTMGPPTEPAEEPAEEGPLSIDRASFCDRVDTDMISAALDGTPRWHVERAPGDTYEAMPGSKQTETRYVCVWNTWPEGKAYAQGDASLALALSGEAEKPRQVDKDIDEMREQSGAVDPPQCTERPVPFDSDPGYAQVCDVPGSDSSDPAASATAVGLVGDTRVTCYVARVGKDHAAGVEAVLDDVCAELPALLGS